MNHNQVINILNRRVMSKNNQVKKTSGWKYVLLGEIPGILMGVAGTMMAADYLHAEPEDKQPDAAGEEADLVPVAQVSDEMSFAEAFAAARAEVGHGGVFVWHGNVYNTFYKEEWEAMTDEQKEEFMEKYRNTEVVVPEYEVEESESMGEDTEGDDGDDEGEELYGEDVDSLSVAHVSDDMSFSEAFAAARAEVGAGGVFMWHGNAYNTFYKEEWDSMSDEQKQEFMQDFHNTSLASHQPVSGLDELNGGVDDPQEPGTTDEIDVEVLSVDKVTFDDGTTGSVAGIVVNGTDGVLADINDDGIADVLALDVNADGSIADDEIMEVSDASIQMPTDLLTAYDTSDSGDNLPDYMNDADTSAFA